MTKQISGQNLDASLAQLPKEMSPERDLWPGIERAIVHQQQDEKLLKKQSGSFAFAWAASVIAAVLITWIVVFPQQQQTSQELSLASAMEQDFEQSKKLIMASLGQDKSPTLSPKMKEQLAELASARATINKTLKDDPNNSDLLNLLHWTQQQELELLKKLYSPQWQTI